MTASWSVVVPVKRIGSAKTRLAPIAGRRRKELALAFACDTVEAARAADTVERVLVVTDDRDVAAVVHGIGAQVIPDIPNAGLNPALRYGAAVARERTPDGGVVALSADLPALRPAELTAALDIAAGHDRTFIADAAGDGTTLLAAAPGSALQPAFGPQSAERHRASGAYEIVDDALDSLRLDVDTEHDLRRAAALGLGPRSSLIATAILRSDPRRLRLAAVQATVRQFDPDSRSGTVLLDDGVELPFDAAAFDQSGLRLLRLGQRVRITVAGSGADQHVTFLTLATL